MKNEYDKSNQRTQRGWPALPESYIKWRRFYFFQTKHEMWTFLSKTKSENLCSQCGQTLAHCNSKLTVLTVRNKCNICMTPKIRLNPKTNSIELIEDVTLGPNEKVLLDSNLSMKLPPNYRATIQPFVSDKFGCYIAENVRPLATYCSTEYRGPLVLNLKNTSLNRSVKLFAGCTLAKLYLNFTHNYSVKHYDSTGALPRGEAAIALDKDSNGHDSLRFLKQTLHEFRCQCRPHAFVGIDEVDCGGAPKEEAKNEVEAV